MKARQIHTLQACERTLSFLDANASILDGLAQSRPRHELDVVFDQLANARVAQRCDMTSRKNLTNGLRALRTNLVVDHMRPIAAIAEYGASRIPQHPPFSMTRLQTPLVELVAAAYAMARAAAEHEPVFVAAGLRVDFIPRLMTAASDLQAASVTQRTATARAIGETASITTLERRARQALRALHPLMAAALAGDRAKLQAWDEARRISPASPTRVP